MGQVLGRVFVVLGGYQQGYAANYYGGTSSYNQTDQSYGGSGQQVAASVPGQQMSYQNTHSFGAGGSRGVASGYTAASDTNYAAGGSFNYQDSGAHYDARGAAGR